MRSVSRMHRRLGGESPVGFSSKGINDQFHRQTRICAREQTQDGILELIVDETMHPGFAVVARIELPAIAQMPERPSREFHLYPAGDRVGGDIGCEPLVKAFEIDIRFAEAGVWTVGLTFLFRNSDSSDPFDEIGIAPNVPYQLIQVVRTVRDQHLF